MKNFKWILVLLSIVIVKIAYAQEAPIRKALDYERYKTTRSLAGKSLRMNPTDGMYDYYIGLAYIMEAKTDSALYSFNQGKDKSSDGWMNLVGLGRLELDKMDSIKAKEYFSQAFKLAGDKSGLFYYLVGDAWVNSAAASSANGLKMASKMLELEPKNSDGMILQGDAWILLLEGGGRALTSYENASDRNLNYPVPYIKMGRLYKRAKNIPLAIDYFKQSIAKDSTFAPGHFEMAEYYYHTKKYAEAAVSYDRYLAHGDTSDEILTKSMYAVFLAKDYEKSMKLAQLLKGRSNNPFILNRISAYSYYERGMYPEGLKAITELFAHPDSSNRIALDYQYYAKFLLKDKQDSAALPYLIRASELDSSDLEILVEIGKTAATVRDYPLSVWAYEKKMSKSKPTPNDYYNLGMSFYYMKDYWRADSMFLALTLVQASYYQGFLFRARCNSALDPDAKTEVSKQNYEQVVTMISSDPAKYKRHLIEAYEYLSFYSVQKDDKKTAVDYFNKILELEPDNKDAQKNLKILKEEK